MDQLHFEIVAGESVGPFRLGMTSDEIVAVATGLVGKGSGNPFEALGVGIEYNESERCERILVRVFGNPVRLTLLGQEVNNIDESPAYELFARSPGGIDSCKWEMGDDFLYEIRVFRPRNEQPPDDQRPSSEGTTSPTPIANGAEPHARAEPATASQVPIAAPGHRVWGIKLGSGGRCVTFCERHQIVGVGWRTVGPKVLTTASRDELWGHVKQVCTFYSDNREVGKATGQLFRFARECREGDYLLYYDPPKKVVRVCRVVSGPLYRDFDTGDPTDIWHYRRVEYPVNPIPVLDLHGSLKGGLLGPRMSFWEMGGAYTTVDQIARGLSPGVAAAPDPELAAAYRRLQDLVIRRAEALNEQDWEWLVVDYLKAQGASVDERRVGGNRPIIDAEARFDHGEFGDELWRVQVKRYQNRAVDWPEIERDFRNVGEARFCFVSVFGFTDEARRRADDEDVRLLEAGDFVRFLLGGKLRSRLREKLQLPFWTE